MSAAPLNVLSTKGGKVRPICEFCGRTGRAVVQGASGHVDLFALGLGWSCAPYPPDFVHRDGSRGDLYSCPACTRAAERGEGRRSRSYLEQPAPGTDDAAAEQLLHVERSAARAKASYRAGTETRQGAEAYVSTVLGDYAPEHDVAAIVDDLHEQAGRSWDLRRVPSEDFWRVVRAHGLDVPAPAPHCPDWPLRGHPEGCP